MRSATGHTVGEPLTGLLDVKDPEIGSQTKAAFVISQLCPMNLLGRDMLEALNIGVVPTPHGMKAVRISGRQILLGNDHTVWEEDLSE